MLSRTQTGRRGTDKFSRYTEQRTGFSRCTERIYLPRFPQTLPILLSDYRESMSALAEAGRINRKSGLPFQEPEGLFKEHVAAAAVRVARSYGDGAFKTDSSPGNHIYIKSDGLMPPGYISQASRERRPIIVVAERETNPLLKASKAVAWAFAALGGICLGAAGHLLLAPSFSQLSRWETDQSAWAYAWAAGASLLAAGVSWALQLPVRMAISRRESILQRADQALFEFRTNPYRGTRRRDPNEL